MLRVLKVCMGKMVLENEMQEKEDCCSSMMKRAMHGKHLIMQVRKKKKQLINAGECERAIDFELGRGEIWKVCKGCESDSMGTSAKADDGRTG